MHVWILVGMPLEFIPIARLSTPSTPLDFFLRLPLQKLVLGKLLNKNGHFVLVKSTSLYALATSVPLGSKPIS